MWYLNGVGDLSMRVKEAWLAGFTGKGVVLSVVVNGIEKDHPDLSDNFDPLASANVAFNSHDVTPDYTGELGSQTGGLH